MKTWSRMLPVQSTCLASHYSAIGDTISCNTPYSVIGFRGKLFLRYPLVRSVFGPRSAIFTERRGGVAAVVCNTIGSTVRQGYCYTCLAIGGRISVGSLSPHVRTPNCRFPAHILSRNTYLCRTESLQPQLGAHHALAASPSKMANLGAFLWVLNQCLCGPWTGALIGQFCTLFLFLVILSETPFSSAYWPLFCRNALGFHSLHKFWAPQRLIWTRGGLFCGPWTNVQKIKEKRQ